MSIGTVLETIVEVLSYLPSEIFDLLCALTERDTYSRSSKRNPEKMDGAEFGRWAEARAAGFLKSYGMKVLTRNFRVAVGELDIVARDRETIVFVEVKAVRDLAGSPELKVNAEKRRRLIAAAKAYIARFRLHDRPARFDIVTVQCDQNGKPVIRHEEDAFYAR